MKTRSIIYGMLSALLLGGSLSSCLSSNEDEETFITDGHSARRVYILNEGTWEQNNAGISLYDTDQSKIVASDIYYLANKTRLGDVGQRILAYKENIYVLVAGSQYIARLDWTGKDLVRHAFSENEGQPRDMVAEEGKIYVTLYSGNVVRLDAATLQAEKMVKVGNNPEYIIEEDGKLYLLNSGWGKDNRLSIIDLRTFDQAEHVEVFTNPEKIIEVDGHIIIQGYGANYNYPVALFDATTKKHAVFGQATHIAGYESTVYAIYSATDWNTGKTLNTFYTYNVQTGTIGPSFLKSAPEVLFSSRISMLSIDEENGEIFIGTGDYVTNGDVYRFSRDGTLIDQFESGGVGPRQAIFYDYMTM